MRLTAGLRFGALALLVALYAPQGPLMAQQRLNTAMHASAPERLAMLAERVGKSALQMAQGVLVERARRALRDSVREFDALLTPAAGLASDAESRDSFVLLGLLWKDLRAWAHKPPTRDNVRGISERAEEVSWTASKAARQLAVEGTAPREALSAMRTATLAQRVARLYLLTRLGAADDRRRGDLDAARSRLADMLAALVASPHTLEAGDELRLASTQHEFLAAAMRDYDAGGGERAMELIVKTSDNLADSMERLARLYEGQVD